MTITHSRGMSRVPQLRPLLLPSVSKRLFGAYLSRLVTIPHLLCTVHLADTRPYSPTALAYKSITHANVLGSSHAIYGKADHAPTCAYRLPSFPIVNLAHITLRFLIACLTCTPMTHLTSSPSRRRRCPVSTGYYFSCLSTALDLHFRGTTGPSHSPSTSSICTTPATRSATASATQIKPTRTTANAATTMTPRCRSTVVKALFAFVIVSHDTSHTPQIDTSPPPDACRSPGVWGCSEGRYSAT